MNSDVPAGWHVLKIKDFSEVISGSTPDTSNLRYWNGKIVWITPDDLSKNTRVYIRESARTISNLGLKNSSAKLIPKNSIAISSRAPIGYVAIVTSEYTTNQGCKSLRLFDSVVREYIYYALVFHIDRIKQKGEGTTFAEISKRELEKIPICLPINLHEQSRIANILLTIDNAIDRTKELVEKRRKVKQGLMQDLFSKGLDGNGKMHSDLKNSELGQIPRNWSIRKIGDFFKNLRTGSTPSRKYPEYFKGNILWVTSGELKYRLITDTLEKITEKAVKETSLKLYPAGTFFIAITGLEAEGTLGSCAMIGKPATTNQSCMAFEKNKHVDLGFLFQYYCYFGKNLIYKYAQGTKQQSLNRSIVEAIPIKIPATIEEQKRIAKLLSDANRSIFGEEEYLDKLIRIKSGLMQDLLTGRVRVAA